MSMIAKLNGLDLQLSDEAVEAAGRPAFFNIEIDGDRLVLTPAPTFEDVTIKLASLDLQPADVVDAVAWARQQH